MLKVNTSDVCCMWKPKRSSDTTVGAVVATNVNWAAAEVGDVPAGVTTVTLTTPPAMSAGLTTVIVVSVTTVRPVPGVVPKSTAVAPVKPVPVIVTRVPPAAGPLVGLRPVTEGRAWATVRVKFWVASGSTPLAAVMVNG